MTGIGIVSLSQLPSENRPDISGCNTFRKLAKQRFDATIDLCNNSGDPLVAGRFI